MDILFLHGEESQNIIGCYADIEGFAAVVLKVFHDNSRYEIIDCFLRRRLELQSIAEDLIELANIHQIKYWLGNAIASSVYNGGTLKKNYEIPVEIQWETNEIKVEKLLFLTECYLNEDRLKISVDVDDVIDKELRYFDLQRYLENGRASHRLFAFFHAINGANPITPSWAN
ncbi:hypothetical protein [Iningainema tapete]|uniref:Uncharacterized protein n=1 Tax=Iningainema tapete BLCC-T55 TaxID=2748662 RepID=A0A8J7CAD3_9CYAN|nr:hypothetical protein [Iningainema tapete]MBD2777001.1 hypothetical protein [Iningainema tapete BLCC-T55]